VLARHSAPRLVVASLAPSADVVSARSATGARRGPAARTVPDRTGRSGRAAHAEGPSGRGGAGRRHASARAQPPRPAAHPEVVHSLRRSEPERRPESPPDRRLEYVLPDLPSPAARPTSRQPARRRTNPNRCPRPAWRRHCRVAYRRNPAEGANPCESSRPAQPLERRPVDRCRHPLQLPLVAGGAVDQPVR
jgi:hypothetical protein